MYDEVFARLEEWVKKDGGFYDITRSPESDWSVALFPDKLTPKMKESWVSGNAKSLKTAVDRAFKELEKVSG